MIERSVEALAAGVTGAPGTQVADDAYHVRQAWYMLVVFQFVSLIAGMESSIITLLVRPIESTFQMSDVGFATITAVPLYLGIAAVYYPAGLLADTFRRRNMIAAGVVIWGLAALLSSRADSSTMLFLARLMAGAGLGVSGPATFSIISDAFPRTRRALAISVNLAGLSLGGGLGLTLCEALIQITQRHGSLQIGSMLFLPWQQCFVVVAAMGVVVLGLVLTVAEPPRKERAKAVQAANLASSLRFFGQYLRRHGFLWGILLLAYVIYGSANFGIATWAPTFGLRRFGATGVGAIALLGVFNVAGALVGSIVGGLLAQRAINRGNPRALPRMYILTAAIGCIFSASFPYMPSWPLAVGVMNVATAATMAMSALIPIGTQETVPNEARGQIVGVLGLIILIPAIIGSTLVAFLATHVFAHTGGLMPALSLIGGVTGALAVLLFAFVGAPFERAQRELRALDAPSPTG